MKLEEQLKETLKTREEDRKNIIKTTTLLFSQAEERVLPCKDIFSIRETTEETWSPEARKVFLYAMENSDLSNGKESYKTLYHLIEKVESTGEIYEIADMVLWMTSFSLLADDDKEVDDLIEKANNCNNCREFMTLFTMQYLVMDAPMPPEAISVLVHSGHAQAFRDLIWCDTEGLANGMYWVEEPQDTPWRQLCKESNSENVTGILDYVKNLKKTLTVSSIG